MYSKTLRHIIYSLTIIAFLGCAANTKIYPGPNYREEPISYATIKFTRSQKFMGGGCDHWVFDACKDIEPNSIIGIWTSESRTMPILSTHFKGYDKFTLLYLYPNLEKKNKIADRSNIVVVEKPSEKMYASLPKRKIVYWRYADFSDYDKLMKNNIESIVPIPVGGSIVPIHAGESDRKTFSYLYLRSLFTVGSIAPGDTIAWKAKPGMTRLAVVVICSFGGPPFYGMSDPIDIRAGYTYHVDYKFKTNTDHVFEVHKTRDY